MEYKIGMVLEGTITGLQPYGAFVSLSETVQGLIHVSEVQAGYTKNIHSLLTVGQKVSVQIIDIDEYSKKISLSLRTLESQVQQPNHRRKKYFTNKNKKIGFESLAKELPIWTEEAMDKLLEK
ncbi:CvfD/Ygs/GSP13 family RNA-binding post-transcriptional regulator [Candidatus Enterococcus mansonii]|uniref:General stress protein 13 n=1 Tax=Candidatus Enterococcus mansonii TaxID=1834181 RepID=A0A242CEE5_9ENTE|nr:CvfD/Ygs/GSP13 family RNA-binding post-transcriptional regulator [Enterococcus sp. 4G2_DIV0659]OTO08290.1 general stress protein 13 [Enterococcus sp. 4G2_DIV0659]